MANSNIIHAVWFIRDTSIRDMVEFPKQTKGQVIEGTICSDIAKGQFDSKYPSFFVALICYCVKSVKMTLKRSSDWSQKGCHSVLESSNNLIGSL